MNVVTSWALLFAALVALPPAFAQDPPKPAPAPQQQDNRAELKQRIAARHPALEKLRDAGKVGETQGGEVKLVKAADASEKVDPKDASKGTIGEIVDAENKDRRAVYEIVAKEQKTTAAEVAKQAGIGNLSKAKPDHWVEVKGQWVQRKTVRTEQKDNK